LHNTTAAFYGNIFIAHLLSCQIVENKKSRKKYESEDIKIKNVQVWNLA
jgi:hypothetical protein